MLGDYIMATRKKKVNPELAVEGFPRNEEGNRISNA